MEENPTNLDYVSIKVTLQNKRKYKDPLRQIKAKEIHDIKPALPRIFQEVLHTVEEDKHNPKSNTKALEQ